MNTLPRRRTRRLGLALAATVSMLAMAACGGDGDSDKPASSTPAQELVVGSIYEHDGFDPLNPLAASANGERLIPVFDTLLRVGTDGDVHPHLAEAMESEDGKTWVMSLRPEVTFTDDTPLDAEAVIFNVERHRAPDSPSSSKSLLDDLKSMKAQDEHTVVFELGSPNYSFPYLFTASGALGLIGSPTALEGDAKGFNQKPVGAGPFEVVEWVPDDHVTMKRNPDYWGEEPGYETLTFRVLPDPQARENALRSGQIDLTVSVSNFEALEADDSLELYTEGVRGAVALLPNVGKAPFDDLRVRQAVQLAFDPANTRNAVFGPSQIWDGERACLPFATGSAQCDEAEVATDVAQATSLVEEYVADGNSPALEILATSSTTSLAEYVSQVLTEVGLEPKIRAVGPAEHIPALYGGDYQLGLWQMAPFESFYPLGYTLFASDGRNVIAHSDKDLDEALTASVNGATLEERDAGLRDAQARIDEQALVTWLSPAPLYMTARTGTELDEDYLGGLAFYPTDATKK